MAECHDGPSWLMVPCSWCWNKCSWRWQRWLWRREWHSLYL